MANFQSPGTSPVLIDLLKMIDRGSDKWSTLSFSILAGILSGPWAVPGLSFNIFFLTSVCSKNISLMKLLESGGQFGILLVSSLVKTLQKDLFKTVYKYDYI